MDFFKSVFYRVLPYQSIVSKPPDTNIEQTEKYINLQSYKFDVEKFDKEVENKCIQNMFYIYK